MGLFTCREEQISIPLSQQNVQPTFSQPLTCLGLWYEILSCTPSFWPSVFQIKLHSCFSYEPCPDQLSFILPDATLSLRVRNIERLKMNSESCAVSSGMALDLHGFRSAWVAVFRTLENLVDPYWSRVDQHRPGSSVDQLLWRRMSPLLNPSTQFGQTSKCQGALQIQDLIPTFQSSKKASCQPHTQHNSIDRLFEFLPTFATLKCMLDGGQELVCC